MSCCFHIIVKGKVHGVCFRAHTQQQANNLDIRGFVRNLADGDVEILAQGQPDALQQLLAWSREGPPRANVCEVIVNERQSCEEFDGFEIR